MIKLDDGHYWAFRQSKNDVNIQMTTSDLET